MCISFAVITIPGLKSQKLQLGHYLNALQCALENNLNSETDSLYRTALKLITNILDIPDSYALSHSHLG